MLDEMGCLVAVTPTPGKYARQRVALGQHPSRRLVSFWILRPVLGRSPFVGACQSNKDHHHHHQNGACPGRQYLLACSVSQHWSSLRDEEPKQGQDVNPRKPRAHPESNIVAIPEDVNFADLMTLIESMYFGEVTLRKHQLFALIKAADVLKVHGRCMFTLDKSANESACDFKGPSAVFCGPVRSGATKNVQDSSLQFTTISDLQEPSTAMYAASIEQINACSSKDCMSKSAVEATKNLADSKQEQFSVTAFPSPSTSMEASGTSSPSLDAMTSNSLDSLSSGSKLSPGSYKVPESMKFVEDDEVGHPLTGVDVGGASTVALDMPDAGGDATQQASGAGAQPSAPGPDLAPLPSHGEGSSSGTNLLRPIKAATRKRAASASHTQATSLKPRTEESSWNGPITRSRAARLAKQ
ncbi:hypothetical protein HPB51_014440 [Rhipicephalus microplus]|uniref:BTB domain-containing protein n=1 Tax=Rhipicephalus microplus TaxID=6941 RepID=A0A9J6D5I2_RHIMP|nr:hypothetical protein HPB51_014440 [Rhipicephalus microplus]